MKNTRTNAKFKQNIVARFVNSEYKHNHTNLTCMRERKLKRDVKRTNQFIHSIVQELYKKQVDLITIDLTLSK